MTEQTEQDTKLSDSQESLFKKAVKLYEKGCYKRALEYFENLSKQNEDIAYKLRFCVRFCQNVVNTPAFPKGRAL